MIRFRWTVPAILFALTAVSTVAPAEKPIATLDEVLDRYEFDDEDREKIQRGEVVSHGLDDEVTDSYLGVIVAVLVPLSPDELIEYLGASKDHREDPDLLAYGSIDPASIEQSLSKIEFTRDEAEEIRKLLAAEPGSEFNLGTDDLARFAELRKRFSPKDCPDDPTCVDAVTSAFRGIMRARVEAYLKEGVAGIEPYAREDGERSRPQEELDALAETAIYLKERRPDLFEAYFEYPRGNQESIEHTFQWFKIMSQDRPNFLLSHRMEQIQSPVAFETMRNFYASHSFNCSTATTALFPVGDRTFFIFLNRSFTDQVTGFMSGTRKKMGTKIMGKHLRADLERLQESLESP